MKKLLIWIDDYRDPLDTEIDWLVFSPIGRDIDILWVKSYDQFTKWINAHGLPDAICFDHDLGLVNHCDRVSKGMSKRQSRKLKPLEKTGHDCAKWLVEYCLDMDCELPLWNVQSANPVGKDNINGTLNHYKNRNYENMEL